MADWSKVSVYGALAGNLAITATKFTAAAITGSSAMLSEGIHSAVDSGDQVLLLIGMRRSELPPDAVHPFGHGKELYFWSLLVAVLIFGVGGGVSIYEGILHVLDPEPLRDPLWNYVVLGSALVFESASLAVAFHAFLKQHGAGGFWAKVAASKDPTTYTVIAEDMAAVSGLVIAFAGVYLSHTLDAPVLDGVASILIGLLLAGVATVLIRQCRGLLIGAGLDARTTREIEVMVGSAPLVRWSSRPLSMYFGPDDVLLAVDVQFDAEASALEVGREIAQLERQIKQRFPFITRIYVEASGASAARVR
ncbi:cation diffusion facilitator family transporter [Nannocystis punicea]|uniref:Cation diffusion facilitator family transporter n=1 Tax=Nannocystis punicea TaxID=2995304 RepID=A0ABY7GUN4_9BACT|nr:cation diffusion facilitator family transporter [Nannocystis poenicansa]WAS90672.1 cation diffusion facilitator family transporter [Nannocystis poenicansa]